MTKKRRIGLQIRFNPESEQDLVDFFSTLKKSEVHIIAISAFRMYMRQVGFYDSRRLENCYSPNVLKEKEACNHTLTKKKADCEKEGIEDEEAFRTLDGMFDNENELND
jgi:hypothetical protein